MKRDSLFPTLSVLALLVAAVFLLTITLGCGGGAGAAPKTQPSNTPAPTVTLGASATTIQSGGSTTLTWQTTNTTSVTFSPSVGSGPLPTSGSASVKPTQTTTYTLTATGAGGTQQTSVTVTVTSSQPPPSSPTATLTVNPTSIQAGQTATLSWSTTQATSVTLNGAAVAANNPGMPVGPTQTTTYTLTATGAPGTQPATQTVTLTVTPAAVTGINHINHIIYMLQENRGFDSYFGQLGAYKAARGLGSASDVDGLPPGSVNYTDTFNGKRIPIPSFHFQTACTENSDPDWLESHGDFNLADPGSNTFKGDGYVHDGQGQAKHDGFVTEVQAGSGSVTISAHDMSPIYQGTSNLYLFASPTSTINYAIRPLAVVQVIVASDTITLHPVMPNITPPPGVTFTVTEPGTVCALGATCNTLTVTDRSALFTVTWNVPGAVQTLIDQRYDQMGSRGMGYYNANDLAYYYFMAATFATSDRWFSPIPSNSVPNRVFTYAATTYGHVHDPGTLDSDVVPPIFARLDAAGISWKVYYTVDPADPTTKHTALTRFQPFANNHLSNLVPLDPTFMDDLQNGTLPQVAFLEELPGLDEHPGATLPGDIFAGNSIQDGQAYVANLINAFMSSQYWNDGAFILTYDEAGGFYDHVAGQTTVLPDNVAPMDLRPEDIADIIPQGTFNRTGFRVPITVVSKFAKASYVNHTPADHTAILKFIEARFGLKALTARDAAQVDSTGQPILSQFFAFDNPPFSTPPTPPPAPQNLGCNYINLQPPQH